MAKNTKCPQVIRAQKWCLKGAFSLPAAVLWKYAVKARLGEDPQTGNSSKSLRKTKRKAALVGCCQCVPDLGKWQKKKRMAEQLNFQVHTILNTIFPVPKWPLQILESVLLKNIAIFKLLTALKCHFKSCIVHKPHFTLLTAVIFHQGHWGNHRHPHLARCPSTRSGLSSDTVTPQNEEW